MASRSLPPFIAAQLSHLYRSVLPFKVEQLRSGSKASTYFDRFTLLIPFCLDYIKWDVIFNAQYPHAAPDIVFSEEDDGFHPLTLLDGVGSGEAEGGQARMGSLVDWNYKDPSGLLRVILELRELYSSYQRKCVEDIDDERLKFEISTFHSRKGIEVCVVSGTDRPKEVKFAIPLLLDMDLNKLVQGCHWKAEQKIYLQVVFPVQKISLSPSAPHLMLSATPDLKVLFSVEDVKLPKWLDGMCMAEYIPSLEESIRSQILEAVSSISARRCFIKAVASLFGRPVEADPVFCRKATVLVASGGFTLLVHFFLSTQFPKQQPALTLQSSSHFDSQGMPITSRPLIEYPWSPRWEAVEMAERIFEYLSEECLNFKKYCNDAILQMQ